MPILPGENITAIESWFRRTNRKLDVCRREKYPNKLTPHKVNSVFSENSMCCIYSLAFFSMFII